MRINNQAQPYAKPRGSLQSTAPPGARFADRRSPETGDPVADGRRIGQLSGLQDLRVGGA